VDVFGRAATMSTTMAETSEGRRARWRFDDDFRARAVRAVLDEGRSVGAVRRGRSAVAASFDGRAGSHVRRSGRSLHRYAPQMVVA
jgi:transposase-like protein